MIRHIDAERQAWASSGRVALVTGSDPGIGQAIAEAFAGAGADVALTYRSDRDGARETVRRVEAAGRRALLRQVDVSDEGAVTALFAAVAETLGPLDVLVDNAGTGGRQAKVADIELDDFDRVMRFPADHCGKAYRSPRGV